MPTSRDPLTGVTMAILAVLIVGGTIGLVFYQVALNRPVSVPEVMLVLDGGVVTAFFTHQAAVNGGRQAGTAAVQAAVSALAAQAVPAMPAAAPPAATTTQAPIGTQNPTTTGG